MSLGLYREDFTDILDFVSLLCVHCIEAEKLRKRLVKSVTSLNALMEYVATHDMETPEEQTQVLKKLKLTDSEATGLRRLWEKDVLHKLWEMIRLHEDYTLRIEWRPHYDTDAQERWTEQIRQAVEQLLGQTWDDYTVDIISTFLRYSSILLFSSVCNVNLSWVSSKSGSNTHSVVNCLCPVLQRHKEEILEWGKVNQPSLSAGEFKNKDDLLYAMTYHYEKAFPEFAAKRWAELHERGFVRINFTEFTGIAVDVILMDNLANDIDGLLAGHAGKLKKHLLVNIGSASLLYSPSLLSSHLPHSSACSNSLQIMHSVIRQRVSRLRCAYCSAHAFAASTSLVRPVVLKVSEETSLLPRSLSSSVKILSPSLRMTASMPLACRSSPADLFASVPS